MDQWKVDMLVLSYKFAPAGTWIDPQYCASSARVTVTNQLVEYWEPSQIRFGRGEVLLSYLQCCRFNPRTVRWPSPQCEWEIIVTLLIVSPKIWNLRDICDLHIFVRHWTTQLQLDLPPLHILIQEEVRAVMHMPMPGLTPITQSHGNNQVKWQLTLLISGVASY